MSNVTYTLVNFYAPDSRQVFFLRSLQKKINKIQKGSILLCGDFNCIIDKSLDCSSQSAMHRTELKSFLYMADLYKLCQTGLYLLFSPHKSYSRIDLILSDLSLVQKVLSASIHLITWSEHAPPKYEHMARTSVQREKLFNKLQDFFQIYKTPDIEIFSL